MKGKTLSILILLTVASVVPLAVAGPKKEYNTITEGEILYQPYHYIAGEPVPTGYDDWGYNYQAHLFKGCYCNAYLGGYGFPPYEGDDDAFYQSLVDVGYRKKVGTEYVWDYAEDLEDAEAIMAGVWCWPYRDVKLSMKWNDAWLSNMDRDGDGVLDRYYGFSSYIGSGAWETNHQWGTYNGDDGKEHRWGYFVKIVAVPDDAVLDQKQVGEDEEGNPIYEDYWYEADGTEIGPEIWGAFAVIQRVYNDPYEGCHGIEYLSPASSGFGYYKP